MERFKLYVNEAKIGKEIVHNYRDHALTDDKGRRVKCDIGMGHMPVKNSVKETLYFGHLTNNLGLNLEHIGNDEDGVFMVMNTDNPDVNEGMLGKKYGVRYALEINGEEPDSGF